MSMSDQAARDTADLEKFGYKQELKRELHVFSSFAIAFGYISPSTGIFTLFFLGMAALGGALWWTWVIVALFQFIVALNFAELSSHFPVAGSVYQWTKYLAGRTYAWFTGWIYLFAGILTVASVCATLPLALLPFLNQAFGWHFNTTFASADQKVCALITLALITILNIYGVKIVAIVNNTGVFFEILGMVVLAVILAAAHNNQGVGVIVNSDAAGNYTQFPAGTTIGFFLAGIFMSAYVIYGFDTASTLAEETRNPRVEGPKAVLASVIGAFIIGAIFLWGLLIAVPNMGEAVAGFFSPGMIIDAATGSTPEDPTFFSTLYLFVISAAIFVCCMAVMTATIRLTFGMARDDQLPISKVLSRVSPKLHTPVWACVVIGLLAAIPFIQYAGASSLAVAATASIYLAYLLGNSAVMRARSRGWPKTKAPFSLGGWGKVVNVIAIVYGLLMYINFLWPASDSATGFLRIFTNPSANQTDYYGTGPVVDLGLDFLNKISLIELLTTIVIIVGAIYYFAAQRKKAHEAVTAPTGEDLSGIVSS
jgi:amino acid transporter